MNSLSKMKYDIPFIIGGDYNLSTTAIGLPKGIHMTSYEQSPRSNNAADYSKNFIPYKDNFIYTDRKIDVKFVRTMDFLIIDEKLKPHDLSQGEVDNVKNITDEFENLNNVLDHDPIIGVLALC